MSKLKIKTLLPLLFLSLVVIALVQGAIAAFSLTNLEANTRQIGAQNIPNTERLYAIVTTLNDVRRSYADYLLATGKTDFRNAETTLKTRRQRLNTAIEAFDKQPKSDYMSQNFGRLQKALANDAALADKIIALALDNKRSLANSIYRGELSMSANNIQTLVDGMLAKDRQSTDAALLAASGNYSAGILSIVGGLAVALAVAVAAAFLAWKRISQPISTIAVRMARLADGELDAAVPYAGRKDEIGDMAAAVAVFRDNSFARLDLERNAEHNREQAQQERSRNEASKAREAAEIQQAVAALADALGALSEGDLTRTIETPFADHLDRLRSDFTPPSPNCAPSCRKSAITRTRSTRAPEKSAPRPMGSPAAPSSRPPLSRRRQQRWKRSPPRSRTPRVAPRKPVRWSAAPATAPRNPATSFARPFRQ